MLTILMSMVASVTNADEHECVDLGLPSGTLWATCNVGANSPEEYGGYFAWGETETKNSYNWNSYIYSEDAKNTLKKYCDRSSYGYNGFTDNLTELELCDDAALINWGENWCMPSADQLEELHLQCEWTWTTLNNINGFLVKSRTNNNSIFLPAAGTLVDSSCDAENQCGLYWSRTLFVGKPWKANNMFFNLEIGGVSDDNSADRWRGCSVRPVRRNIKGHEYVDLGLPSGTLWAICNVGANSPEEKGGFFAWGETTTKDVYEWITYKYCEGTGTSMTKYCTNNEQGTVDNLTELELIDDAAYVNWGEDWCMPSQQQFNELINEKYTSRIWTTQNGVKGYRITSKVSGYTDKSIFLPVTGHRTNNNTTYANARGYYWSRTLYTDFQEPCGTRLYFTSEAIDPNSYSNRRFGQGVRPVRRKNLDRHEYVDLGLPSGTLWATSNVGANSPEEDGDYFAWGETSTKSLYDWSTYKYSNGSNTTITKYCTLDEYGTVDNKTQLELIDDAAFMNWGENWCMPTIEQWKELVDECIWIWESKDGKNGYIVESKTNDNSIFLPASGWIRGNTYVDRNDRGCYWSNILGQYDDGLDIFECYDGLFLSFYSNQIDIGDKVGSTKICGHTIRPVRLSNSATGIKPNYPINKKEYKVYNLQGQELPKMQKGINIIRFNNGTTKKVLIK